MKTPKKSIFHGRGNKNPSPTKCFRLAEDIGTVARDISEKYQLLMLSSPNEAAMLLDELEKLASEQETVDKQ